LFLTEKFPYFITNVIDYPLKLHNSLHGESIGREPRGICKQRRHRLDVVIQLSVRQFEAGWLNDLPSDFIHLYRAENI